MRQFPPDWGNALPQYEKRVQMLTAAIKRDAFIVAQIAVAIGDLTDEMQKLTAIQRALDRIEEAQLRAGQDPPASPRTRTALQKMHDALKHGREQGTMADLVALRRLIMTESADIQRDLFRLLAEARGERLNLIDLLNKVQTLNADLEGAMVEALGSTFDFMAAGGK